MTLYVYQSDSADAIVVYVAAQAIPQSAIQSIVCDSSGRWSLWWWA